MLEMKLNLEKLDKENNPIKVAVVGIGKMGRSLTERLLAIKGMIPALIVNRHVEKAYKALVYLGIEEEKIKIINNVDEFEEAYKEGFFAVTDKYEIACKAESIDAVVEATGNPKYGAEVAYNSIMNKKHIIMLNVECDTVIGPSLYKLAQEKDVVYTGASGDEPAAIMELVDFAMGLGFNVVACGKGKNNPKNIHATNGDVSNLATEKKICDKSLTAFVDATNTMIELNSVGNAIGFKPDVFSCHGIQSDLDSLGEKFQLKSEGGVLDNYGILDYVQGIAPGVFVVIKEESKETVETLDYVGMKRDGNYILYRPYHLCSLETPISIYKAVMKKEATIAPLMGQVCDTVAHAKRDLKKGETINGIGSDYVYGSLTTHEHCMEENLVPIALISEKAKMKVDVKKDQLITYDMIELEDSLITRMRKAQDEENV